MLAIASCAGDEWINRAIAAALKLSSSGEKTVSAGNELLSDIQNVFEIKRIDRISTVDLITALCDDEEAPWQTYNRGKPIVPRQLIKQLEAYDIKPKRITFSTCDRSRGFELLQFDDSFLRYLAPPVFICPAVPKQHEPAPLLDLVRTDTGTQGQISILSGQLQATNGAESDTRTDKTVFLGIGLNDTKKSLVFDTEVF